MIRFQWGSCTDPGRVRSNNQDSSLVIADHLFAVADGMGGHRGGEVASRLALSTLEQAVGETITTKAFVDAVLEANGAVHDQSGADPELEGMGTTLCAIGRVETDEGERIGIINVGDSRVYRMRGDSFEQLTDDHSLVANLVRQGRLTEEEALYHPQRNILTRALGIDSQLAVDSWELAPVAGDRYLLCSDGLFNEVDDDQIAATLRRLADPLDACKELVRLANDAGGRDNITAVLVELADDDSGSGGHDDATVVATATVPPTPAADEARSPGARATAMAAALADAPASSSVFRAGEPAVSPDTAASAPAMDPEADLALDLTQSADEAEHPDAEDRGSRRLTWRVAAFTLALLIVAGAAVGAIGWYARNTFFVGFDADTVTIFKGRPGGVLWFDPTVAEMTTIDRSDVPDAVLADLEAGRDQATLGDAQRYVDNLQEQIDQLSAATGAAPADRASDPATTSTTPPPP